jgi:hypothetical protein
MGNNSGAAAADILSQSDAGSLYLCRPGISAQL